MSIRNSLESVIKDNQIGLESDNQRKSCVVVCHDYGYKREYSEYWLLSKDVALDRLQAKRGRSSEIARFHGEEDTRLWSVIVSYQNNLGQGQAIKATCTHPHPVGDKFCSQCGVPLSGGFQTLQQHLVIIRRDLVTMSNASTDYRQDVLTDEYRSPPPKPKREYNIYGIEESNQVDPAKPELVRTRARVQDLIDPSLHAFCLTPDGKQQQWIPAQVRVSADGQAEFKSPINNLNSDLYPQFASACAHIFS